MKNKLLFRLSIFIGKVIFLGLQILGKQGTALPGKIALKIYPSILNDLSKKCEKIIVITGTNGKTTTNNLINHILNGKYENIVSNLKGANMIQGVVTSFIVNNKNKYEWGIFEVDEGSVPNVIEFITPNYMILTNFFRDQLDRYGEVDNTVKLVYDSLKSNDTTLIINADDPLNLKFDDLNNNKIYYGVEENNFSKKELSVAEAIFCVKCGKRLEYDYINYGNIGKFKCERCGAERVSLDYSVESIDMKDNSYEFLVKIHEKKKESFIFRYMGIYNIYNCLAAITFAVEIGLDLEYIKEKIENFEYKLGRMETINFPNKDVILVLSKNPVGLSEVLSTIAYDEDDKSVLFILNDEPADGKDISWIWDANIEEIADISSITNFYSSGMRSEEVSLRIKYAGFPEEKIKTFPSCKDNIKRSVKEILNDNQSKSYIIGTFTAMPKARKILIKEQKLE
ncbi:UDP-N-acetylmuramate--L-alanine ligase [Methanobrevibacter cuticularis]|uniref:Lipid II isoglutaminyl synthase (glutamine-hydrolyzing) subunit MurT n=1 Tax=Methanobrevibacter cuticularis TaxID=47311 RepID=A0A166CKE5_9EURY|nr:MurT ligase domain-containing protein [Methanobrevibacter cuticularis]KZX15027.1 UDP-N-acetylmuramate--L-alanine ligase [Methanobrevibacter cuticularis]